MLFQNTKIMDNSYLTMHFNGQLIFCASALVQGSPFSTALSRYRDR